MLNLLRDTLLPVQPVRYGQVESPYGSGQFIKGHAAAFPTQPKLVTSEVTGKDDIMDSIREFLKGGRCGNDPAYLREHAGRDPGYADGYGLSYFPQIFDLVDYRQMCEIASYGGFPCAIRIGASAWNTTHDQEPTYRLSKIYGWSSNRPLLRVPPRGQQPVDQKS